MRTIKSARRGCGLRTKGGAYLVSEPSPNGVLPLWISFNPPIPCEDRFHRGPVLVDGDAILAKLPEEEWFVGSSADHREKLRADEWAIERFGMTTTMRMRTGVCKGATSIDEAMEILLRTVRWNNQAVYDALRSLTVSKIFDITNALPHLNSIIQHIQNFPHESHAEELVLAAAAVWRTANALSPSKYDEYIPYLMRILTVIGLGKDAIAMRKRFTTI